MLVLIVALAAVGCWAQDIELPRMVPAFNQAYNEGPNAWGDCQLGTVGCPDQVCTTGCLVTAFASVLAYYEISLSVPAHSSCTGEARTGMDPGIFNDWLRDVSGYGRCSQDPVGNCCLIWGQLPDELEITTHVNRSDVGLNPVAAVVIDHALRLGDLVVAGVHWSAFCNGGSTQSEDCHWVILTGKRNGIYTIVDPFNPDPTNPRGVRTTLDVGVHGAYIIDRFVIVTGPPPGEVNLDIQVIPQQQTYQVGQSIQMTITTPGRSSAYLPFTRVTNPSGTVAYAVTDETALGSPRYVVHRESLVENPRSLDFEWTWFHQTLADTDVGRWSWEIWIEGVDEPGTKLGRQILTYEVESPRTTPSVGAAIIGVLLIVAIVAITFISTLGTSIE